jgi:hypothetical protein
MAETTLATGACNSAEPERPNLATYSIRQMRSTGQRS